MTGHGKAAVPCQHRCPRHGVTAGLLDSKKEQPQGVRRGSTGLGVLDRAAGSVIMEKFIHYFYPLGLFSCSNCHS